MKKIIYLILLVLIFTSTKGQSVSYPYIKPLFDFNPILPVFKFNVDQKDNKNHFLRYYALTGYREGVESTLGDFGLNFVGYSDKQLSTRRIYMYNLSIQDILTHGLVNEDRVILKVKDPSKYHYLTMYGAKEAWMRKYAYCFEMMLPEGTIKPNTLDSILAYVFGLKFHREKLNMKALVLYKTSRFEKFKSKGVSINNDNLSDNNLINVPMDALRLAIGYTGMPFIDDTGYLGNVDLKLGLSSLKDLSVLRKELAHYDLGLKEEMREVNMFIITEN